MKAGRRFQPHSCVLAVLVSMAVASFDLILKGGIVELMMQPPHIIPVTGFLNLRLSYNTGIVFGLFSEPLEESPIFFSTITALVAFGLLIWAFVTPRRSEAVALALIAGGAIGNIVDRVLHGAVTDYLDIYIADWHWPTFNLADIAIVSGSVLLIMLPYFAKK